MDSRDSNFQSPADSSAFGRSSPSPSRHQSVRSSICRSSRSPPPPARPTTNFFIPSATDGQRVANVVLKMPLVKMSRAITVFVSVSVRHLTTQHSLHRLPIAANTLPRAFHKILFLVPCGSATAGLAKASLPGTKFLTAPPSWHGMAG